MRGCAYSLHLLRHFPPFPFPHTLSPLFRRVLEECSKPASAISHGSAELLKPVNAASQRGCGSNRSVEKSRVCGGLFSSSPHLLQQHKLVHLAVILALVKVGYGLEAYVLSDLLGAQQISPLEGLKGLTDVVTVETPGDLWVASPSRKAVSIGLLTLILWLSSVIEACSPSRKTK